MRAHVSSCRGLEEEEEEVVVVVVVEEEVVVVEEWVTATDIRVTLNRLNTFGDEVFNDPKVLKSYYYAISDFAVGGRWHGPVVQVEMSPVVQQEMGPCDGGEGALRLEVMCALLGDKRPCGGGPVAEEWGPCGAGDRALWRRELGAAPGSLSTQCARGGRCSCKPGVTGDKCDRCQPGYHTLTEAGCRPCSCDPSGSTQECDVDNGRCQCKDNVEGFNCDRCKLGFFNLDPQNPQGCTPCFCFQHSSVCDSADGYSVHAVSSTFHRDDEGWTGQLRDTSSVPVNWSPDAHEISLISDDYFPMYFIAPEKFLGNQLLSYGQNLSLNFRADRQAARLSAEDLVLEGAGLRVTVPLIAQGNAYPTKNVQTYVFRDTSSVPVNWSPDAHEISLISDDYFPMYFIAPEKFLGNQLLSYGQNLSLNFRADRQAARLSAEDLVLEGAGLRVTVPLIAQGNAYPTKNVQTYVFRRLPGDGAAGPRGARPLGGALQVSHGLPGPALRALCPGSPPRRARARGLQRLRALQLQRTQRLLPPHLSGASCAVVPRTREVVCTNCPAGTTGKRCELCDDGFFGDPLGQDGPVRTCHACNCRGNMDPNAVGNCDRETGECLKCIYHTAGFFCDRCKDACACSPLGTLDGQTSCAQVTGQCPCLSQVSGRDCSACEPGFYNLASGTGCERCGCDRIGSTSGLCDITSGQCECQPGVAGQQCERCEVNFFGFGLSGCKPCDCDPEGSQSGQCREDGRCECRPGFVGARCDMCEENYFYNRSAPGCQQCPNCYSLVRDKVNQQRQKLHDLQTLMDNLGSSQDTRLAAINGTLTTQWNRLQNIRSTVDQSSAQADKARTRVHDAEGLIERARHELDWARDAIAKVDIKTPSSSGDPNNMTLLAEEARALADKHKMDADQIEKIARDANETSTKAYNLLMKTLDGEGKTGQEIDELNRKYNEAKELAKALEKQANKVHAEAEEAGERALQMMANLTSLPSYDTTALETEASKIKKEASDLDKLIDKTEKEYQELRDDLRPKEQETADQLLARADAAKALAEEAAKKGRSTYEEAQDILANLRDFDQRVNDNKTAAEEAMRKIPAINATILAANEKTRRAEAALGNAAADARQAKATAEEAEKIASAVQKGSAKTKVEAEKAFQDTNDLEKEVGAMMDQLSAAEDQLGRKKAEADQDMMMAAMASDNAKEAEVNARKAKGAVKTVLGTIADLLEQLGNIDKVDLSKLNQIDESLKKAKGKMAASELDKKLRELSEEEMITDYDRQIGEIRDDIANLEDIKKTLPDGCFNTPSLERP
ncbi:hypothetical protein CRUP_037462 [Coryphaenoides rupestris]|nr:hypothetical protein CRUP_037462 [Coryphaenoides rupestris]